MAPFRWPDDTGRLDLELLQESPVARYHSLDVLDQHVAWLREHQYVVHRFDCSGWRSEGDFHDEVARELNFPGYYGRNLDAFNDCLCDVEVKDDGGLALVFTSFDNLARLSPDRSWHILDILAIRSRSLLLTGQRLMTLVQTNQEDLRINPVGARPVLLNTSERLTEVRRGNPGEVRSPASSPCQAPPGYWGEDECPAQG